MKISKSLVKQTLKYDTERLLNRNEIYISWLGTDINNILHINYQIPPHKIYKKGIDLTGKKLLIITAFAIGDTIHLLPVLKAIKRVYEGVYIGIEYKKDNKILEFCPYIDELVSTPVELSILDKFDYVFDLTAHVATPGFDNRFVPDYLASLFDEKVFGFYEKDKKPDINLSEKKEVLENINKIKELANEKPILGIHFEASSIHRRIPPEVLDIVLNYAKDKYTIVCAYTESGKDLAKEYFEKYPFIVDVSSYVKDVEHLINYVGILDILISAETSVGHIGVALGVPTLVVLGVSSFYDVYDYKVPYVKGVNARYIGTKCSSPCRIHALSTPCPEARYLKESDYSPCFKFIDKIELLETFKYLERLKFDNIDALPDYFETYYSYYYKNKFIEDYIGRAYWYFYKYRHSVFYFIRDFAIKHKTIKIEGFDKILYEEILKNYANIDENSDNVIITDGFYKDIDFKSLQNKKAIIIFANKNRVYNLAKKGLDVFDFGVVRAHLKEYTKNELENELSKYFDKFRVFESPANFYEYEKVFGKSIVLEDNLAHNSFLKTSINSLQGAFLIAVINDEINFRNPLDTFSAMQYEYLTSYRYSDVSFFTKSPKTIEEFDIVELRKIDKPRYKVFLAFEGENLYNFYHALKDFNTYTAFIPKYEYEAKKEVLMQTLSNIGIDIVFSDFKNLKQKTYLNYISSKIVFIDNSSTYEDLINQFKDKKDKKDDVLNKLKDIFSKFSPNKSIYISSDKRVVEFLKDLDLDARHIYGYYFDMDIKKIDTKPGIYYLSEASIHKTYADNSITEFFIKKLSNFRTSLKALKEDIALYDLREYFYDYLYMGAYACKYNDKSIRHVGNIDFDDEMVFRVALSTITKTRDFPEYIFKKDIAMLFNPKNIIIGLSDIISDTINPRLFEAFSNKTMFITDYKPILEDIFGKYAEYISGFSIEDIVEKATYFKENKQEAREIIKNIRKRVKEFEFKNVLRTVL
ncbi:glycosyltransferase family protein [Hydrogenobaculum acidophilum]